jgi:hypothetical protein
VHLRSRYGGQHLALCGPLSTCCLPLYDLRYITPSLLPYDELQNQMDDDSSLERGDGRDILLGPLRTSWRPTNLACTMLRPARK